LLITRAVTWLVPLALGGIAIALMALFTTFASRKGRHPAKPAQAAGPGPRILVHDINDDRCTGCDACVSVCPTNVLDLVSNKSRVLRFQDCIQCEACMWACPTEALVMFPEGGEPPKLKVPELDENFQTMVPGQYLIGEVAGKPLVKNAANLGRAVIEHALKNGLEAGKIAGKRAEGSDAKQVTAVDVAIVGSGPGGLSAALTCMQRGLSYVVLEKEQLIASTVSRYPKGKFVMAEPYDTQNLSLLPVMDSSKEQMVAHWKELVERVGLRINQGEAVETVKKTGDGTFDIRTTVASYRASRVVLATGTRGKPRTLQVPGENLPKVVNLLDDPDEFRGKSVLVIGGGDSAVEAAMALADAGAKVIASYRGKSFNRCQAKNKQAIESYAAENRLKIKFGSQVVSFDEANVVIALDDGSQKQYPNDATFVLIGADPPIAWLEKLGVKFVERPHQYSMGKTDEIVRRFLPTATACPDDAAAAAARVLGKEAEADMAASAIGLPDAEPVSGPRKWLRQATQIFAAKKIEQPMPLSEFARRGGRAPTHTGNGRRDALSPGERTRVLRMLRDVGGRIADEESRVDLDEPVRGLTAALDASPPPELRVEKLGEMPRPRLEDVPAKQAVIVGLAKAMARGPSTGRIRRITEDPAPVPRAPLPPPGRAARPAAAQAGGTPPGRAARPAAAPPAPKRRPPAPAQFNAEPTRRLDPDSPLAADLREALAQRDGRAPVPPRGTPQAQPAVRAGGRDLGGFEDEATRAMPEMMAVAARPQRRDVDEDPIDVSFLDASRTAIGQRAPQPAARRADPSVQWRGEARPRAEEPRRARPAAPPPRAEERRVARREDFEQDQATVLGDVSNLAAQERRHHRGAPAPAASAYGSVGNDDPTGAIDINDSRPSTLSDIDWDLD
jgi:thioredoxin reductase (NADPH)